MARAVPGLISIAGVHRGVESAPAVSDLIGAVLDWPTERRASEVAGYVARVEADRGSQDCGTTQTPTLPELSRPKPAVTCYHSQALLHRMIATRRPFRLTATAERTSARF